MSDILIAEVVILDIKLEKKLDYRVPDILKGLVKKGVRITVTLFNRIYTALVVDIKGSSGLPLEKLKNIRSVIDVAPVISEDLINLGEWMIKYYFSSVSKVYSCIIPSGFNTKTKEYVKLLPGAEDIDTVKLKKRSPVQYSILTELLKEKEIMITKLKGRFKKNIAGSLKVLVKKGIIKKYDRIDSSSVDFKKENRVFLCGHPSGKMTGAQKKVYSTVEKNNGKFTTAALAETSGTSLSPVKTLIRKKILKIEEIETARSIFPNLKTEKKEVILTDEQEKAYNSILENINNDSYRTFLLKGVTGSGKTEVYLRLISEVIKKNGSVIMLVPEISITPQTVSIFKSWFGDRISVMHSQLSIGEKYEQWKNIVNGKSDIVIGPRSAVFAAVKNLKLILVDEEHEISYKQNEDPCYNGRDVAVYRGMINKCTVVLGSATPSLESYYNVEKGKYSLLELKKRVKGLQLPEAVVYDIKKDKKSLSRKFILGELLKEEIKKKLLKKEQIILFMNRRGFSTFVKCLGCGYSLKCPNCDISLTFHKSTDTMLCHYCGYSITLKSKCPECGSKKLRYIGFGTEKVEMAVNHFFPGSRSARIDSDTVRKKGMLEKIYKKMMNNEIDILIGTQIIAKGLDFPNVTLVGILLADITLNLPDFRAAERAFNLMTQVEGRAGRDEKKGKVIIQTFEPGHYSITAAVKQDYELFYTKEIEYRKNTGFPPFSRLISIRFSGEDESEVKQHAKRTSEYLKKNNKMGSAFLGPVPAVIPKLANKYRYIIIIKGYPLEYEKKIIRKYFKYSKKKVKIRIDVDPQSTN